MRSVIADERERTRPSRQPTLEVLVAYHEAAHLVIAVYNGIGVHGVISIEPAADGSRGRVGTFHRLPLRVDKDEGCVRLLTMHLAGDAVERQREPRRERRSRGDGADRLQVLKLLTDMYPGDDPRFEIALRKAERRASAQVRRLQKQIDLVAKALLRHRTLDAQSVRDHLYSCWSRGELEQLARRTGSPLSWMIKLHDHPVRLSRGEARTATRNGRTTSAR
jgi:hypothetical protein